VRCILFSPLSTPYQSLKVLYNSVIEWEHKSNILQCHPDLHHHEHYDYVLIKVDDNSFIFALLLYLFSINYSKTTHVLALILPMDVPPLLAGCACDATLQFTRVLACPYAKSAVVSVDTIVQGVLLVKEYGVPFEIRASSHIVIDTIDADMWWRMKSIKLEQHVNM
jgi:hypothetical protein